jgi:hypothetical protein
MMYILKKRESEHIYIVIPLEQNPTQSEVNLSTSRACPSRGPIQVGLVMSRPFIVM